MLALRFILDRDITNIVTFHCNGTNSFMDGQEGSVWIKLYLSTWIWVKMLYDDYMKEWKGGERRRGIGGLASEVLIFALNAVHPSFSVSLSCSCPYACMHTLRDIKSQLLRKNSPYFAVFPQLILKSESAQRLNYTCLVLKRLFFQVHKTRQVISTMSCCAALLVCLFALWDAVVQKGHHWGW